MVKTSLADFPFHLHICTLYNSFALEMSFQVHRIAIFFVFLLLFVLFFYFCIKELLILPEHLSAPPGFSGFLLLNIQIYVWCFMDHCLYFRLIFAIFISFLFRSTAFKYPLVSSNIFYLVSVFWGLFFLVHSLTQETSNHKSCYKTQESSNHKSCSRRLRIYEW